MEDPEGFEQSVAAPSYPTNDSQRPKLEIPSPISAVCSFWRDILSSNPQFWTLVVLFVDSKPTPLVDVSLFLEWLRKHQIDVFITRRGELSPAFTRIDTKNVR